MNKNAASSTIGGDLVVIASATILAGLSTFTLVSPASAPFGAVFGLLWGFGLRWVALKLAEQPYRHVQAANLLVLFTITVTSIQLGGGVLHYLLVSSAVRFPEVVPFILRPEVGGGLNLFFMLFNSLAEYILIPLVLLLNWRASSRRNLLLIMAIVFYMDRAWTYLYFAPTITDLTAHMSNDAIQRLSAWSYYNGARVIFDVAISILSLIVAMNPLDDNSLE